MRVHCPHTCLPGGVMSLVQVYTCVHRSQARLPVCAMVLEHAYVCVC